MPNRHNKVVKITQHAIDGMFQTGRREGFAWKGAQALPLQMPEASEGAGSLGTSLQGAPPMQLGTLSFEDSGCMPPTGLQRALRRPHNGSTWYHSKESDVR